MPLPIPRPMETQTEFISRFMSDEKMNEEYPDRKQRYAVAIENWKDNKKTIKE